LRLPFRTVRPLAVFLHEVAEQLQALHAFSEELKSVLGVPSFYNESIGSTCEVTAYDRLKGRGPAPRTSLH